VIRKNQGLRGKKGIYIVAGERREVNKGLVHFPDSL
jgi:hypothetical protein